MTPQQYRTLRNYLQALACCVNIYSREYANLNKRIAYCHDRS